MITIEARPEDKINIRGSLANSNNFIVVNNDKEIRIFKDFNCNTFDIFNCFMMMDTVESATEYIATEIAYNKQTDKFKILNNHRISEDKETCEILLFDAVTVDLYSIGDNSILIILNEKNHEEK